MRSLIVSVFILFTGLNLMSQTVNNDRKIRPVLEKGMIISSPSGRYDDNNYDKSATSYDMTMVGVYTGKNQPRKLSDYIVSEGIIEVLVNNENGTIKKGDIITSSSSPGEGMKATKTGMTLGIAMQDATGSKSLIPCRLMIEYTVFNLK